MACIRRCCFSFFGDSTTLYRSPADFESQEAPDRTRHMNLWTDTAGPSLIGEASYGTQLRHQPPKLAGKDARTELGRQHSAKRTIFFRRARGVTLRQPLAPGIFGSIKIVELILVAKEGH